MPARALVVGASSDIGRAVAVDLAGLGHDLVLWGRDTDALARTARACADAGDGTGTAVTAVVDVTDSDAVRAALADVPDLAVAVWAAGVFDWAPAHEADPATWAHLLSVNLTAAAAFTPLVLPLLARRPGSALVYLGSGASRQAFAGNAAYVASKHGLAGLARATFLDVRDLGVKVSLVSPGLVAAGAGLWSPAGRQRPQELLAPEDVAAAVRFVVTFPARGCPVEVEVQPQRDPDRAPASSADGGA